MAQIIEFKRKPITIKGPNRWMLLSKGLIEHYTCDTCGTRFEVVNNEFPKSCPGCGRHIEWGKSEVQL